MLIVRMVKIDDGTKVDEGGIMPFSLSLSLSLSHSIHIYTFYLSVAALLVGQEIKCALHFTAPYCPALQCNLLYCAPLYCAVQQCTSCMSPSVSEHVSQLSLSL